MPTSELCPQGGPDRHHTPPAGLGQEIGQARNMAVEGRDAKSNSTPTMGHQLTSHQQGQGHRHDTSGTRFYRVPSFENINYLTSLTPHHLKGHAFTLKDMGIAKGGGVIKEHPTLTSKSHANVNNNINNNE